MSLSSKELPSSIKDLSFLSFSLEEANILAYTFACNKYHNQLISRRKLQKILYFFQNL